MVNIGQYNTLKVVRLVDFGAYLDGGGYLYGKGGVSGVEYDTQGSPGEDGFLWYRNGKYYAGGGAGSSVFDIALKGGAGGGGDCPGAPLAQAPGTGPVPFCAAAVPLAARVVGG